MIQTTDPDERKDILSEAQNMANKRVEKAKKHSYAAVKKCLVKKQTEADKAFEKHHKWQVKV